MLTYYFLAAVVWVGFLEYYTTNHLLGEAAQPWKMRERIVTLIFWPISFVIFVYNFIKALFDGEED
jgi:hypothetical protein